MAGDQFVSLPRSIGVKFVGGILCKKMSVHYVLGVILEFVFWTLTDRLFRFCGPCLLSLRVSVAMARAAAPKKKEGLSSPSGP